MKFISAIILIIFFLFKTGNVLSNNSIFHVNNIEIDNKYYKNKDKFFNQLFKDGFDQLSKKILLKKDYQKLQSLSIKEIKNLISHYEIIEPKKNGEPISSNIFFDRTKLNTFFFKNKIAYCDFDNTEISFFPLLIENNKTFIFDKNYFFENWKVDATQIEYILPVESIEFIENIKKFNSIGNYDTKTIFEEYNLQNNLIVIININEKKTKILLKGFIGGKPIIKNLIYDIEIENETENKINLIKFIDAEIIEIYKTQNMIDLQTPSFLNAQLDLKKTGEIYYVKEVFNSIDTVEYLRFQEINKDYIKIKIKFYGKLEKLTNTLKRSNLLLEYKNNDWKLNFEK